MEKNHRGFGFLTFENAEFEDLFLPPHVVRNFFQGDLVEVTLTSRDEVDDILLIKHRLQVVFGKIAGKTFIYETRRGYEEVFIPKPPRAKEGEWVKAKLVFTEDRAAPIAEILEVLGPEIPSQYDLEWIACEFALQEHHSKKVVDEALSMTSLHAKEVKNTKRSDLTHIEFVTIDGEDARDFDDAVYVEKKKHEFVLWVAIADVSTFVSPGTKLNEEALERATSVYFPERAFHMLPGALSENLCSLRPNEERLALTAKMTFDFSGKLKNTELMSSVIRSRARLTYTEVENNWNDPRFASHVELYEILNRVRMQRGALDFQFPEAKAKVDEKGEPISIEAQPRLKSHRLIEEFMLAANESVTQWVNNKKSPFIYRIHEQPSELKLQQFAKQSKAFGAPVDSRSMKHPKSISKYLESIRGIPGSEFLESLLLRSLRQARYSAVNEGHFGLASSTYTHFTSPIRRYPDLLVHRIVHSLLKSQGRGKPPYTFSELEEFGHHCSFRERLASDAERESLKIKQVRLLSKQLGNEFVARVQNITENGIFLQIESPFLDGVIPKESLNDDFYEFHPEKVLLVGKKTRKSFRIGQKLVVQAMRANLERRLGEFRFVSSIDTRSRP